MAKRVSPRKAGITAATSKTKNQGEKDITAAESDSSVRVCCPIPASTRQHSQAGCGLTPGPIQLVIKHRVFKGDQVELGGMLHQAKAHMIGEFVAQQAVTKVDCPRKQVA